MRTRMRTMTRRGAFLALASLDCSGVAAIRRILPDPGMLSRPAAAHTHTVPEVGRLLLLRWWQRQKASPGKTAIGHVVVSELSSIADAPRGRIHGKENRTGEGGA